MRYSKVLWISLFVFLPLLGIRPGMAETTDKPDDQSEEYKDVIANLPTNAVIGSTTERYAAFQALTNEQKRELFKKVGPYLEEALNTAKWEYEISKTQNQITDSQIGIIDWYGKQKKISVTKSKSTRAIESLLVNSPASLLKKSDLVKGSAAANSMPLSFQDSLADLFTPYYHVAYAETDQFATFNDYVPTTIKQLYGQSPLSHYRVHPLGFTVNNGIQYGFFKIDYLTLWNNDSGLYVSSHAQEILSYIFWNNYSSIFSALLSILDGLGGHQFDDEHSAILVGAPTLSNYEYNPNPNAYYIYSAYAAAHEGTQSDHSTYTYPETPQQGHLELFLAYGKHGTYFGNPNLLPLAPQWAIDASFSTIANLYWNGYISYDDYMALLYCMDVLYYEGIVEHFALGPINGFAYPRINVGEPNPGQVLNNSGFILDPAHVLPKLQMSIWQGFTQPPQSPTMLTVTPSTLTLPGSVIYHVDVPNISVNIEYYLNGNGPYYTADYGTMTSNGNGDIQWNYGAGSNVGTYTFARIQNVAGGPWNSISGTLVLQNPPPPSCEDACYSNFYECLDMLQNQCYSVCPSLIPYVYPTLEECIQACGGYYYNEVCLPPLVACMNCCQ
jgi:hypothetical protein